MTAPHDEDQALDDEPGEWISDRQNDLHDPTPSKVLNDFGRKDWTGNFAPDQVDAFVYLYTLVRELTHGPEDARERMPFTMGKLEHAIPLSASLFGQGRSELVEMLKHHEQNRESIEAKIAPIEHRSGGQGGGDRGL
jgi:hypothetical protein